MRLTLHLHALPAGASQMISTSVASISGMASARNAISPEQAKWQRLCSALVILTGSATAAVTLLVFVVTLVLTITEWNASLHVHSVS
jgi:hypothetical protein